jgi:transcriptional regulator with XRE-family HTH domain
MAQIRNQALLKRIANRIRTLREAKEVTQEDFYNDTGIHLGRIETGKMNVTVSTLDVICKYFGLSLGEFFTGLK